MVVGCNQRRYNLTNAWLGINRMIGILYEIILVSERGLPRKTDIRNHPLCDEVKDKGGAEGGKEGNFQ